MSAPQQVKFVVTTQSQVMNFNDLPKPLAPVITINGVELTLKNPPTYPTGYRITILDAASDYTNPATVLYDACSEVYPDGNTNQWASTYTYVYDNMVRAILSYGNTNQQLVIVSSFGLDNNMPPTNGAYQELIETGAGSQLQNWVLHNDTGSQVGNSTSWVSFPANYLFLGLSSLAYGQGFEVYQTNGQSAVNSSLTAVLANVPAS
ncbi:MAG: hypothetical protein KDC35_20625 [Acidobacteria bacterium]|nr:hypothetical protein [Acidobacteriota bacterium]